MSDVAIRVENLGKRYRIGVQEARQDTLVGAMLAFVKRPGRNLQRLRRLTRFSANGMEEKDVVWALRDVSFEVKQGEVVGVIGRNGAGKSTLLKVLSRITYPTTGRIELHGRVSSLLEVGTGFHPELTGRENVYLNGTILGMRKKEIDRKFDEIVDFSGVEKFIDTPVKYYSSGMRVRLAFSVAAHLEPEILMVDEVLAVGDTAFQKRCLGKMDEIAKAGRTVLFVSHNMAMVRKLCERTVLLNMGKVELDGKTDDVIESYERETHYSLARERVSFPMYNERHGFWLNDCNISLKERDKSYDLLIEVELESEQRMYAIGIGFSLFAADGTLVSRIAPAVSNFVIETLEGRRRCTLRCEEINRYLAGGDYNIELWISQQRSMYIIRLENLATITLPSNDLFNTGYLFEQRQFGVVPLPVRFIVHDLETNQDTAYEAG